jgi:DUF1680 family protein
MDSEASIEINGKQVTVKQKTSYPVDGKVEISVSGSDIKIAVRVPEWCNKYEGKTDKGYMYLDLCENKPVELDFTMETVLVEANPLVIADAGKYAVMRGPLVYCMEGVDNGSCIRDIRIDADSEFILGDVSEFGAPTIKVNAFRRKATAKLYYPKADNYEKTVATLIPYYAFANRGETEMQVWHFVK